MKQRSPGSALRRLGFRLTIKGGIIIGLIAGLIAVIQGVGYAEAYPDQTSRQQFAMSLESAPALGVLYGEPKNLDTPEGYMVYRAVPVMALIGAIWGLAATTKLLRSQEEDGQWDLLATGVISKRQTNLQLLFGFGATLITSFLLATLSLVAISLSPDITLSLEASILMAAAMFLPAAVFAGLGVLSSQLALSRRRSFLYGVAILAFFYILRAIGTVNTDASWLKNFTPFGWSENLQPVLDPQLGWIGLLVVTAILLGSAGIYIAGRRDVGASLLPESDSRRPRFMLLGSPGTFNLRQNVTVYVIWTIAALTVSILMIALSEVAAKMVEESQGLQNIFTQFGGSHNARLAFVGAGMLFTVMIVLIMMSASVSGIRSDEARNYLDTILAQPVRRSTWLIARLLTIFIASTSILLLSALVVWLIADYQGFAFDLGNFLLVSVSLTGTGIFLVGLGALLYGILPRLAAAGMYFVITWSFLIDALSSAVNLDEWLVKTSLFQYIAASPVADPDWVSFWWLTGIGITLATIGIFAFTKRDIVAG